MSSDKHREEVANTHLGDSLHSLLGFDVKPEICRADKSKPDVLIRKDGLTIVLEAKYENFGLAVADAQGRWTRMNPAPDIVGAVSYSEPFRHGFAVAVRNRAAVEFALSGDKHLDLFKQKRTGEVYDLAQLLRRPHSILDDEDEIKKAINRIGGDLSQFANAVTAQPGLSEKLAVILQANFEGEKKEKVLEQSAKVAGLILFGAVLFQFALADKDGRVNYPNVVLDKDGVGGLAKHWKFILDEINYIAIFKVAHRILTENNIKKSEVAALIDTAKEVQRVAHDGVDLMGRVYHELLADAKPLGAFYTSIPAATLMAGLALNLGDWKDKNWDDANSVSSFRVADPACGSGTLLAAACWQILDNFSREHFAEHGGQFGGKEKVHPRIALQRALLEEIIWGYDILETAGHLTATTLGLMSPEVNFKKAHIYRAIIGETKFGVATGSLDLLERTAPFTKRTEQVEGNERAEPIPELDLCIMNPPFVRGTLGNESFSFLAAEEQKAVHQRMRELGKNHAFVCDKGQGPAFMALACLQRDKTAFIRKGGKLATILPSTAASGMGKAWSGVRAKIEKDFNLETIIVSREEGKPNFSENTNLQECILIARKRKKNEQPKNTAMFVVLHKNPQTVDAAHATVGAILRARQRNEPLGDLRVDESSLFHGDGYIGEYAQLPWRGESAWRGLSFANLQLSLTANNFAKSGGLKPLVSKGTVALKLLGEQATIGSHRLDLYIKDRNPKSRRARFSRTPTEYAGYYPGHYRRETGISQKDLKQISEPPQCYWLPLPGHEKWADEFIAKAGRIVLCQSFGFSSMRRLASLVSKPVQASCYWPIKLHNENEEKLKTMVLWLNSTPALLLIANAAQTTKGTKVKFSQAAAKELPVLDLESLDAKQIAKAAAVFDDIVNSDGLLPLPKMKSDEQRIKIDKLFSDILGLGDLAPLRAALAVEPIITGKAVGVAAD